MFIWNKSINILWNGRCLPNIKQPTIFHLKTTTLNRYLINCSTGATQYTGNFDSWQASKTPSLLTSKFGGVDKNVYPCHVMRSHLFRHCHRERSNCVDGACITIFGQWCFFEKLICTYWMMILPYRWQSIPLLNVRWN